jgi:hypothetical protein
MLPTSHKSILTPWLNFLQDFQEIISEEKIDFSAIQNQWQRIQDYLQAQIVPIQAADFSTHQQSLWQTWQTETYRCVRLLNTELLFWQSAQQSKTKRDRYLTIKERLEKMIQLTKNLWESLDNSEL